MASVRSVVTGGAKKYAHSSLVGMRRPRSPRVVSEGGSRAPLAGGVRGKVQPVG